ncbi:sulfotransferase, partial [bacterium]|nr:sulfotransferase [bacterium]
MILSARFRSGSTLFWNLFREIPSCTAYYEPFNERRWFDAEHRRGHTDPTHRGVSDYWQEYAPLAHLGDHYRDEWINRRLFMDEHAWDPGMKAYLAAMIERAPGRPVLQFNRLDFRLPWIRRHFPRATILHLHRHPRDVWMSSLVDPAAYPASATMDAFLPADHYYLTRWALDLRHAFPFLDPGAHDHAYPLFYLVWKLSYLFARRFADRSIAFEELVSRPEAVMTELAERLSIPDADPAWLATLVDPPRPGRSSGRNATSEPPRQARRNAPGRDAYSRVDSARSPERRRSGPAGFPFPEIAVGTIPSTGTALSVCHPEWARDAALYQLNTRQFTPEGTFAAAEAHLPRLRRLGVDVLWLLPIHEIGVERRKGRLGSPYAVRD